MMASLVFYDKQNMLMDVHAGFDALDTSDSSFFMGTTGVQPRKGGLLGMIII